MIPIGFIKKRKDFKTDKSVKILSYTDLPVSVNNETTTGKVVVEGEITYRSIHDFLIIGDHIFVISAVKNRYDTKTCELTVKDIVSTLGMCKRPKSNKYADDEITEFLKMFTSTTQFHDGTFAQEYLTVEIHDAGDQYGTIVPLFPHKSLTWLNVYESLGSNGLYSLSDIIYSLRSKSCYFVNPSNQEDIYSIYFKGINISFTDTALRFDIYTSSYGYISPSGNEGSIVFGGEYDLVSCEYSEETYKTLVSLQYGNNRYHYAPYWNSTSDTVSVNGDISGVFVNTPPDEMRAPWGEWYTEVMSSAYNASSYMNRAKAIIQNNGEAFSSYKIVFMSKRFFDAGRGLMIKINDSSVLHVITSAITLNSNNDMYKITCGDYASLLSEKLKK